MEAGGRQQVAAHVVGPVERDRALVLLHRPRSWRRVGAGSRWPSGWVRCAGLPDGIGGKHTPRRVDAPVDAVVSLLSSLSAAG